MAAARDRDRLIVKAGVCVVPVLHGRLEFAAAVRRAWSEYEPRAVAVELPRGLTKAVGRSVARLPNLSVVVRPQGEGLSYLLIEPTDPAMEAIRLAESTDRPWRLIDAEAGPYPVHDELWPDPYAVGRLGLARFAEPFLNHPPPPVEGDLVREQTMAHRLQELVEKYGRVLFVCGLGHAGRIMALLDRPQPLPLGRPSAGEAVAANLDPESIKEVTTEIPYLMRAYEEWRQAGPAAEPPDRVGLHEKLLDEAAEAYRKESGQEIQPWQRRVLRQFRRNWALIAGRLTADFYQLVVSAKGVGGDEYAFQVWSKAVEYPWQELHPGWETIRLRAEDLSLSRKRVKFFKPLRRTRPRLVPLPSRQAKAEAYPGQWREIWERGSGICSFPPEDLVIEDFGRQAARKALKQLAEANRFVEPFTVSMRDGIDFRETVRRVTERRLYVFEERAVAGRVGAVVVVFDPDEGVEERFPWKLTWLGEHQDESDMALYATYPGEELVGPGVSRCRYGGLVMTYPPMRMLDVWQDPFFDPARTKAERLLLAAADYSLERTIAYVAASPPPVEIRNLVAKMGRQIAFLPLGMFAPRFLDRIRTFHVLAGHEVRKWAGDYIRGPGGFRGVGSGGG